ncbi:Cytochrome c-type biogenesis protein CcmH [Candidatus Propionivibrio aalborgensis]|jgi:cytochrome c-type biogenesis protein CcmH|uniref:Cytochrome c-type biogenesis protein n=1 Tax=Candidatus Propionivibrio aalborgensis TaxID=1860101 RepID=A0A1A8XGB6_9RHOO|nr:cytochrome c-type biogenesis protein [Candidatus Propionivibrio aalborgensis]MBK7326516.1 cytochrome c-type biogenesis protein CcmH [Propionivibrio sp.]MBK7564244.1 cytochrome c-type biogenesis protein CcmH [Propionivibrio sp.]MBK9027063.1 cytochrome c-type biogenesis protein CcmH [Propionivibrio sp.]SBT04215.1 Cytochrome c-type biogenesis protein CcmH [Candidatus Propionivibrio aalborgensis]HRC61130.1 cytochrome c-type biogenesis protein CcmH [Candidatus Propionivibrio aalborgensis]
MNASFSKEPHKGREYFSAGFYFALLCVLCVSVVNPVFSKEATPLAEDEVAEKRMVAISSELRCLVCQNESLSGSHAELANDLRREIRTLIKDGKSDGEIMDFMVSRYGDFVRYRPPLKGTTLLLWFGPALLLVGAIGSLFVYLRRRNKAIIDSPLSAEEQDQADSLLNIEEPPK